jgi:hypothetical protein
MKNKHKPVREIGFVNICGNCYTVFEASHAEMQMEDKSMDKDLLGLGFIKYDHRKIFINQDESTNSKKEIIIHEILHGISEHTQLRLKEKEIKILANFLWIAGFHLDEFKFEKKEKK